MPLGLTSGRRFTPLRVATSARSSATTPLRAAFSASSRSTSASSSPRGRPERAIFPEADMAGTGRVRAGPAQPRQLTSARPFAPRTARSVKPLFCNDFLLQMAKVELREPPRAVLVTEPLFLLQKGAAGEPAAKSAGEITVAQCLRPRHT